MVISLRAQLAILPALSARLFCSLSSSPLQPSFKHDSQLLHPFLFVKAFKRAKINFEFGSFTALTLIEIKGTKPECLFCFFCNRLN
jgi:hypothetical protein